MKSTLTMTLGLVALIGVVFGVTIIATHTPPATKTVGGQESGTDDEAPTGPALNFASTRMAYTPDSEDLAARYFPGMFEMSDVAVPVSFWFQNPHKVPVKVQALGRSCTSCSAARVAVFPDAAMKNVQTRAAAASLPISPFGAPNLLLTLAMTELLNSAEWKDLDFDHPDRGAEIPPRAADGTPTWGILQVGIQIRGLGATQKDVIVGMTPGKAAQQRLKFDIVLAGVTAFNMFPPSVALGELPEGSSPRMSTVFYWSGTRTPESLPPPILAGYDPNDPFVQVSSPIELSPSERLELAQTMMASGKTLRVTAAYRFNITVYRKRTDRPGTQSEPDIGPLIRDIEVTGKGTGHSVKLTVAALVTGLVGLTDKKEKIDLEIFPISTGTEKNVTLGTVESDAPEFSLEVAKEMTRPEYLKVTVTPAPQQAQRRFWTLTVSVPPGQGVSGNIPPDSFVVLRAKMKDGSRLVRIPVTGGGRLGR